MFLFAFLLSLSSFAQFNQVDTLSVDEKIRSKIFEFTLNNINVCNGGKYVQLDADTAEGQMLKWYSLSSLMKNCEWYDERYGRVEKVKLEQILKSKNNNLIFRYKVLRTFSDVPQECRVFYSFRDKYYGYKTKIYWEENYDKNNRIPELYIKSLNGISNNRKEELKKFAFDSYNICKKEKVPLITKENTEYRSYRKDWTSEMIRECDSVKQKNGEIKSLKLVQYLSDNVYSRVYRFRVQFDKLSKPSEIRIYANLKDKYRGIFVVDKWYSNYLDFKKATIKSETDLN